MFEIFPGQDKTVLHYIMQQGGDYHFMILDALAQQNHADIARMVEVTATPIPFLPPVSILGKTIGHHHQPGLRRNKMPVDQLFKLRPTYNGIRFYSHFSCLCTVANEYSRLAPGTFAK